MNKLIHIILLILLFNSKQLFATDENIQVIELHSNKTLDQLVLDQNNDLSEETLNDKNNNTDNENIDNEINSNINESDIQNLEVEQLNLDSDSFWNSIEIEKFKFYLENTEKINSIALYNHYVDYLSNVSLDISINKNQDIFLNIINYYYKIGELSKAYKVVRKVNFQDNINIDFYNLIELNYLLSTYQLDKVCEFKNNISLLKSKNYLTEKVDIFCLVLEDKLIEAELQNSILLETENKTDDLFQQLYLYLTELDKSNNLGKKLNFNKIDSKDLIFLYSAMLRIAEIALDENFLSVDPKNLAIPLILNNASDISIRIKAANQSYLDGIISIDSLAALYQSVDFNSLQLNNPQKTIKDIEDNTSLLMSFYYQLANVQIFPKQRLQVLMDFWSFASKNELEKIAYSLSSNILSSIEPSDENSNYGNEVSRALIYKKDYESANKWITFYEQINGIDENSVYSKLLLDLDKSTTIDPVINFINNKIDNFNKIQNFHNKELIYVLLSIFDPNNINKIDIDYTNISDNRSKPSIFLTKLINESIANENYDNFIFLILISVNNKSWKEIHPEHLQLVLEGLNSFNNSILIKNIILEIFYDFKVL